jgi:hypothetical protein
VSQLRVTIVARDSGDLAMAALFAMALDPRIKSADLDFDNTCYQNRSLMLVPNVLLHGNVRHWAALAADRKLTIRNLPREAGDPDWLAHAFQCVDNTAGLAEK